MEYQCSYAYCISDSVYINVDFRLNPIIDAGVFTIAFAIGNLMLAIGKYGVRQFQVSDVEERYSFTDYILSRVFTSILMIIASGIYVWVNYISGLYNVQKCTVVILVCLAKVVDAVEDVFHGMFQQHLRLDVAGKILTIRMISYIVVYLVLYAITEELIITSLVAFVVSLIQFFVLNYISN